MTYIEWTRDLESGIPIIDRQHKQIVDYINELDDACRTGKKDETSRVMEGLLNYTVTHFEFEEKLQEKAGYPYLKAHRRIHEIFMNKIAEIRARGDRGEDIAPALLTLLKSWLVSHIKGEDRDYVEAVKPFVEHSEKDSETSSWLNNALKKFLR